MMKSFLLAESQSRKTWREEERIEDGRGRRPTEICFIKETGDIVVIPNTSSVIIITDHTTLSMHFVKYS